MYERCRERRVAFVFDTPVEAVLEKDGRAVGVRTAGGDTVEADHVVSGAPVPALYRDRVVEGAPVTACRATRRSGRAG